MCESLMQAATWAIGNDAAVAMAGASGGQFQLNIMMPMMGHGVVQSVVLLAKAVDAFVDFCAADMQANVKQCEAMVEQSLSMVTSLNPYIGYERAAALAKEAFKTGKTIRELCREQKVLPEAELARVLDPWRMTEPQQDQ
jgi:fumarate hydratase class II